MSRPSLRLRFLTAGMRLLVKPKLRRTAGPADANRDFERAAPFLFSKPKGLTQRAQSGMKRFEVGACDAKTAILYLHGGAFVTGSARSYAALAGRLSKRTSRAVFLAKYPKLQQAPFPAAPHAVLSAWSDLRALGFEPHQIAIAGDSAGGNLVFGLLATLLARGERPAGVVALSPWVDLTLSGESLIRNRAADPLLPVSRMQEVVDLYLDGASATDPMASPLFADYPNPPPVLVQVGADEVLRSDAERIGANTGATVTVFPHCPHVWQMFDGRLPEANQAMRAVSRFIQTSFDKANR